jgi:hypothetical protein
MAARRPGVTDARAEKEGRSMQQVALAALDGYLLRREDDELTDQLVERGAQRFSELLRRLIWHAFCVSGSASASATA